MLSFLYRDKLTCAGGSRDANVGRHEDLAARRDNSLLGGVEVVAGSKVAAAGGQASCGGELLDLEGGLGGHFDGLDALGWR